MALKFFKRPRICQQLPCQPPRLFCCIFQRTWRLSFEKIQIGEEIVRASAALETRNKLEKNPVDSISQASLIPLHFPRVLLTLVE